MDAQVTVTKAALDRAIGILNRAAKSRHDEDAKIYFEHGELVIDFEGASASLPAAGNWPGLALVPVRFFVALPKLPPTLTHINVRVEHHRFHLGSSSIACEWEQASSSPVFLPANPTMLDYVRLAENCPDADIATAGLMETVTSAQEWRRALETKAFEVLRPLGVTSEDVSALTSQVLRRTSR